MSDSADELILKMQHLEAQAKALRESSRLRADLGRLRTAAQKLAWEAQAEVERLEKERDEAEARQEERRSTGMQPSSAYAAPATRAADSEKQLIRARAKLNYALDQMTEVDRREYEAFRAEVRAAAHGQLADDPLSKKG